MTERFWVGGYTPPKGNAAGIALVQLDGDRMSVRHGVDAASPSFLARHPSLPVVYAVAEFEAEVLAYTVTGDELIPLGSPQPAGAAACHARVTPDGAHLVVTCWGDGRVIVYPLDEHGAVGDGVDGVPATDPYEPAGERPSRAHASADLGDGRFATTDLGFDLLRLWRLDDGRPVADGEVVLPRGTGPRHLAVGDDGTVFVVGEYSCEVIGIDVASAAPRVVSRSPALAGGPEAGDTAAEIALHPSGRWLTVGIRGSHRIAVLSVTGSQVAPAAGASSGGRKPRHHVHVGSDRLLVADQDSDELVLLPFDARTGRIGGAIARAATGSPTSILPWHD